MYWQIWQKAMYVSKYIIFQASFGSQGLLNKDLTVWLDEARPAYTCIPNLLCGECVCTAIQHTHPQKYVCKYIEIKIGEL
jgi:hypothetical protein